MRCNGIGLSDKEMVSRKVAPVILEKSMVPSQVSLDDFACTLNRYRKERSLQAPPFHDSGVKTCPPLANGFRTEIKNDSLFHSPQFLNNLPHANECSWNSLITKHARLGELQQALLLYQRVEDSEGFSPDGTVVVALLNACTTMRNLEKGLNLHAYAARSGLLERDVFVGSALIDMYAKCGVLLKAQEVFDRLLVRDVGTWTALTAGYIKHGDGVEALNCFDRMQQDGFCPNAVTLVCILKACGMMNSVGKGKEVHDEIVKKGLENEILVGNTLIDMYVRCGFVSTAEEVLQKLLFRNVVSWNALITGYCDCALGEEALHCFEQMQHEGIVGDAVTLMSCLKACGCTGATIKGHEIHSTLAKQGADRDLMMGNTLIDMYIKCGLLQSAMDVFEKLPVRDAISWNVLMAGYIGDRHSAEVLKLLTRMQDEGFSLDVVSFVCILRACSILEDSNKGKEIHTLVTKRGLEKELRIGNSLIDMYAKCRLLVMAQDVFNKLPVHDVVSWTTLIVGYTECGLFDKTLHFIELMQQDTCLNSPSLVCSLKAYTLLRNRDQGHRVHAEIVKKGFEREQIIGNALVDSYAKFGSLADAQCVLDKIFARDLVSWTALITGYVELGFDAKALGCLLEMQEEGICFDAVTLICSLRACANIRAIDQGMKLHAEIASHGLLETDSHVGSALVDMYGKFGLLEEAQSVFDNLSDQDVVSWTALLTGYAEQELGDEALHCFEQMQYKGICPDTASFVSGLKACGLVGVIDKGRELYSGAVATGLEQDAPIGGALVDMYSKCGSLVEAHNVFARFLVQDVTWWNALISGYIGLGNYEKALLCYDQMEEKGISHDSATLVCCLKACRGVGAKFKGLELHALVVRKGLEKEGFVGNILVDMYSHFSMLVEAQEVFDNLPVQDVVAWTALIAGYSDHGDGEEALKCLTQMEDKGVFTDAMTLSCGLTACSSIGATIKGRQLHSKIVKRGLESELRMGNSLIDLYGKCNSFAEAQNVFDKVQVRDVVTWNALIAAYSHCRNITWVLQSFDRMLEEGVKPDLVTFVSLLNMCNHAGLVEKGQMHFESISSEYGLVPTLEYYTCMVDLLGRAGHIARAVVMIKKMPCHPDIVIWHAVLGACRKWRSVEFGRYAFEQAVRLDERDMGAYVCMYNIYVDAMMQAEADKIEVLRLANRAWKKPHTDRGKNMYGVENLLLGWDQRDSLSKYEMRGV